MSNQAGFLKLVRSEESLELIKDPHAFALLTLIAWRARRSAGFNIDDLQPGEAMIGDYASCGLTRQEYRTALQKLVKWQFVTTQATSKGTVARLMNACVWDINEEGATTTSTIKQPSTNQRSTISQPSSNHQATTNKKGKNERRVRMEEGEEEIPFGDFFETPKAKGKVTHYQPPACMSLTKEQKDARTDEERERDLIELKAYLKGLEDGTIPVTVEETDEGVIIQGVLYKVETTMEGTTVNGRFYTHAEMNEAFFDPKYIEEIATHPGLDLPDSILQRAV